MSWARFDDQYSDHPKIVEAGPMAELLDVRGIIYSARMQTDGLITAASLRQISRDIPRVRERVRKLIEVERWEEAPGGGWMIHDFLEFNFSRAEREEKRGYDNRRMALNRDKELTAAIKARDGNNCRYCGRVVSWSDRRSPAGATYDHIVPRGPNTLDNVVVSCRQCNLHKGARTPEAADMVLRSESETNRAIRTSGSGREVEEEMCERNPNGLRLIAEAREMLK